MAPPGARPGHHHRRQGPIGTQRRPATVHSPPLSLHRPAAPPAGGAGARYREGKADERVQRGIHISINGIAAGLRNTGTPGVAWFLSAPSSSRTAANCRRETTSTSSTPITRTAQPPRPSASWCFSSARMAWRATRAALRWMRRKRSRRGGPPARPSCRPEMPGAHRRAHRSRKELGLAIQHIAHQDPFGAPRSVMIGGLVVRQTGASP